MTTMLTFPWAARLLPSEPPATLTEQQTRHPYLGALARRPPSAQSLVVRSGATFSTAIRALGEQPLAFRFVRHRPVMAAAAHAAAAGGDAGAVARAACAAARQVAERSQLDLLRGIACPVLGTAGIARAVIRLGGAGRSRARVDQIRAATDTLAETWLAGERDGRPQSWVAPMLIGSAVLGAMLEWLGVGEITVEAETPREGTLEID
jgi:hypothetical protein